jgi:hypothetical protein
MFVVNPEVFDNVFVCNKPVANYLIRNKIPILSEKDRNFYFSNTSELRELVSGMPLWLKVVSKCKKP